MEKIIFEGKTKTGLPLLIRYPTTDDLQIMYTYINKLSQERTFIMYQGEEISLAEEKKFLDEQLEKIKNNQSVFLLAFSKNMWVGVASIEMKKLASRHEGVFGLMVAKEFRQQGIGTILLQTIIDETLQCIPQLKIVTLGVFANNSAAIAMYKKFGFIESGRTPKGVRYRNTYIDHVYMYKLVREIS